MKSWRRGEEKRREKGGKERKGREKGGGEGNGGVGVALVGGGRGSIRVQEVEQIFDNRYEGEGAGGESEESRTRPS